MNTAVTIVDAITRTVVELAFIGAGLKLALKVAPRFSISNPRASQQPKNDTEAKADAPKGPVAEEVSKPRAVPA